MKYAPGNPCLFSLQPELGTRVAAQLGTPIADHEERDFEDGEHKTRPLQSIRDRDVFLLCSLYSDAERSVNDRLVRTLLFLGALRDAGAGRLTAVIPYLCYARKDRRTKTRDPVSTRYIAAMVEAVGVDRIMTVDVHNPAAYENAFRIRTEHLSALPLFVTRLATILGDRDTIVISPDTGGIKRAEAFRGMLERRLGKPVNRGFMEKQRSSGVLSGERLVAEVHGCDVVLVDDLVSSGSTLARAASACHEKGAHRVIAVATHGLFAAQADRLLAESPVERLLVTDTVPFPRPGYAMDRGGIEVVEAAPLLAEAIRRLHDAGSLVELTED